MKNKNNTRRKRNSINVDRIKNQKKPLPFIYSEEGILKVQNSNKTKENKLTEEEKKEISNELEELLNNPNVSIPNNARYSIKNSFIKNKTVYISGNMELEWYRLAQHFINVLKPTIKNKKFRESEY
jgi:hypothetical protein